LNNLFFVEARSSALARDALSAARAAEVAGVIARIGKVH
jgi:hypothetical protein